MRRTTDGAEHDEYTTYDPVAHRFLRLRHTDQAVYYETSSDGVMWIIRRTAEVTFPVTSVQVVLFAGTYEYISAPGRARFDNLETTCSK